MVVNIIILILIIVPISLLVHELGHLFGAQCLKADRVIISIGTGKKIKRFTMRQMTLDIYFLIMFHAHTHSERNPDFSNKEFAFITAMGPLFSLIFTVFFGVLLFVFNTDVIIYFFLFNLWLTITNLIPFKFKNQMSDGYLILTLLK